ncbi:MAG: DNA mismatch repair endonuclease MutL [Bacillota bacterium]|nr:DNA mismatch repair endonuclease MutL [Bacillota bacterium]
MTPVIHILDTHSANQIAAGEVVERPASVVKELVENSLDAGAKHIDITVEGNGVPLIRVRDDGSGIGVSDLPLAVIRHATSKIRQIEDLDYLQTLGFRGEALPSIASVSNLEISSRPADEISGFCLTLNAGEQMESKEVGCPVGTSVTVRNLFFNTPARLKFLKSTPTEFGLISDTIGRMALAHPDIAFSLTHPHQVILQTSGRGDLRETIGAILGPTIARQLIPIHVQQDNWLLEGYISPPDLVRSSRQTQTFVINGRIIRSQFLSRVLEEGYHTLVPVKLHPVAVLHLHVSPLDYDVNVHPTKMDVRFKNEQALTTFISQAVYQTLIASKPLPSFETLSASSYPKKSKKFLAQKSVPSLEVITQARSDKLLQICETVVPLEENPIHDEKVIKEQNTFGQVQVTDSYPIKPKIIQRQVSEELEKPDSHDALEVTHHVNTGYLETPKDSTANDSFAQQLDFLEQVNPQAGDILTRIWPVAQLFNTYILATDGEMLLVIDQHAAHERINYERLFKEFKQSAQSSQALLIPLPMEFTLQEEQVLLEHLWLLNEMGFVLEQFGSRTYLLRGVPAQTGNFQADSLLRQFIEEVIRKNLTPSSDKLLEEWIYLMACKESIKAQDSLSLLEMEQLIAQLGQTQNPYTCPHGRPTMVKMTRSEFEKRFYRT